jgi:hypothetical protein
MWVAAFRHALPAQPEDVRQQKEEEQETVFFGDAVEAYACGVERPQGRRDQTRRRAE